MKDSLLPALAAILLPLFVFAEQTNGMASSSVDCPQVEESFDSDLEIATPVLPSQQIDRTWLWAALIASASAILSAVLTAVLAHWLTGMRMRKHYRIAGRSMIQAFKEEVQIGKEIIQSYLSLIRSETEEHRTMPTAIWQAYGSRLSEGVLSEIVKIKRKSGDRGFPSCEFPLHLARYFHYICPNVESLTRNINSVSKTALEAKLNEFYESTDGVLAMLATIEKRL